MLLIFVVYLHLKNNIKHQDDGQAEYKSSDLRKS